jgi:hypothetical protein
MRGKRLFASLLTLLLVAFCLGESGNIQLTTLPSITVADGRSTVTISAYVRRPSGQAVPDGTQVRFETTLGTIRDIPIVQTVNGVARVILQTGTITGTAKITASAFSVGAVTTLDIEFLGDRKLLSSANEYVEIVAPGYLMFSLDQRIVGAAGQGHGARLRYREIEIEADDLQYNINASEVRAKKAHLKMGKVNQEFEELNLVLTARKGTGTTTLVPMAPITGTAVWIVPWFEPTHSRFGIANIRSGGTTPLVGATDSSQYKFEDLSESTSMVSAKKAVVFPQKEVQFQKAAIMVGGVTVLRSSLFKVSLLTASNIVTDQIFSLQNSQVNINFPYYLTLKPGETSLVRFSTGQQYGRSSGVNHGLSLDYELGWNHGDNFDGGLTLSSLTSRNWGINAHQYIRFDDRTSATAFIDVPQGKSIYGSLNFSKQFTGWGASVNSSTSRTFRGNRFDNQQITFLAEKDPVKLGILPLRFSYGLQASASSTQNELHSNSKNALGIHARTQLIPRKLDGATQLNGFLTVSEQMGHNTRRGLAFQANTTISRQFGSGASALLTYDFYENGFNSGLTGRHQLSFSGALNQGNFGSTLSATRALDVDRFSVFADLGYRLSNVWRLSYAYTLDRYVGRTFVDYTAAIGFRIGMREIGLTYSGQTKRFGIQLLNTGIGN